MTQYLYESVYQAGTMQWSDLDAAVTQLLNFRAAEGWRAESVTRSTTPSSVGVLFSRGDGPA